MLQCYNGISNMKIFSNSPALKEKTETENHFPLMATFISIRYFPLSTK